MLKGHRADRGNQIRSFLREKTYKESHCLQATLGMRLQSADPIKNIISGKCRVLDGIRHTSTEIIPSREPYMVNILPIFDLTLTCLENSIESNCGCLSEVVKLRRWS